jgi:hypothetical protein
MFFNHKSGRKPVEEMIAGTPGGQDIQQFIRFLNPDTPYHTNAACKQGIGQEAGCRSDDGDFGIRASGR